MVAHAQGIRGGSAYYARMDIRQRRLAVVEVTNWNTDRNVKPKRKPAKLRPDVAETAFRVMQEAIGEAPKTLPPNERTEKNADAVKRGRKGGQKGGKARAESLSGRKRRGSAKKAANARWDRSDRV
jgi:hypothetical protein